MQEIFIPELVDILHSTSGIILYRQQVTEIIVKVCNIEVSRAKEITRDLCKHCNEKQIKKEFIQRALNNSIDKKNASQIFDRILKHTCFTFDMQYALAKSISLYSDAFFEVYYPKAHLTDSKSINIKNDFYTFENEIKTRFGNFYAEQTDLFFERAVHFAEKGLTSSAIADARFAYSLCLYQPDKSGLIDLIGFLCQLHLDNDKIAEAKSYCNLGFAIIDPESADYEYELNAFTELREIIRGEDWKTKL